MTSDNAYTEAFVWIWLPGAALTAAVVGVRSLRNSRRRPQS